MSQIIQAILLLSVPLFVYKKWLEYSKQFNLKKRNIVLPLLNSGENPETFRAIRNQIEKNFELKQGVRFQYSLTIACIVSGSWIFVLANLFHGFLEGFWTLLLAGSALSFADRKSVV